jgi:enterochelin esterase family protein
VESDGEAGAGYVGTDKLVCNPGPDGNGVHDDTAGLQTDPPEWTLMAGAKPGTLTASASFLSTIYGQHFPYRVYASANVVKGKPAVFMTFGDGSEYIGGFHTPTVLDNLTASGEVPPTVVLFIDPPSDGDRVKTYDPPTDKYSRFLLTEIMPAAIDPAYTISKDPAAWATGGHSASAEQDWTVLWTTDKFHKFLGHNSSFGAAPTYGVDWAKTITNAPRRDLRVSLVVAAVGKDLVDQRGDWTKINEGVAMALAGKGDDYRLIIGPGTHGGPASQRDFPNALRWAFRNCKFAM